MVRGVLASTTLQVSMMTTSGLRSRILPDGVPQSCHTDSRTTLAHGDSRATESAVDLRFCED